MKMSIGFYDLAVGTKVFNDVADGIVVKVMSDTNTVMICWPEDEVVETYDEAEYLEYGFTAYNLY